MRSTHFFIIKDCLFLIQKSELDVKLDWKGIIKLDRFIKNYTKISLLESYNTLE